MFSHEGKARSFSENARLAIALSGVAGAVNATGFFVVGTYTSHVTGNLARVGDELAQGHLALAWDFLVLVVAFLFGAMTATVLVDVARRIGGRAHYRSTLLLEALLLGLFTVLSAGAGPKPHLYLLVLTAILSYAMGMQNALVTRISGAVVRTTHLTGITTDLGIELVRLWIWYRERTAGLGLLGRLRHLPEILVHEELERAWLHLAIFGSFFLGAVAGPLLYLWSGHLAMALPCLVLVSLLGLDLAKRRRPAPAMLR
ncbi:YoaK family protein [Vulgatibacter sp.]|uniref:YoaK family protein n=1 Tax=Vulgatibacter sp. TaxID=1971226 RepID=UPI003565FBAA